MNELEGRLSEKEGDAAGIAGIGSVYIEPIPVFCRHPVRISRRGAIKAIWTKYISV